MLIGYARTSTGERDAASQLDALKAAGCERCFSDTASGSPHERPQLSRALEELRDGQDTLVVWRLDRVGRSLAHLIGLVGELEQRRLGFRSLIEGIDTTSSSGRVVFRIFGALSQFERQLTKERTQAGLRAARAKGRLGGRPTVITDDKLRIARDLLTDGEHTMQQIADAIGVSRATLYRHVDSRPKTPTTPAGDATPAKASSLLDAPASRQEEGKPERLRVANKTGASTGPGHGRWFGLVADRRLWLQEICPDCRAGPGSRCRHPDRLRKTRLATSELHFARGWRYRRCPTCHAQPGEGCATPSGRRSARPHTARLHRGAGELTRGEAWEELERRGANIATLPFNGKHGAGVSFAPIRLESLENHQRTEIETWSEQRSGDALIEALKEPAVARFGTLVGQPPIRATLTWTVPDRQIMVVGTRGSEPFEQVIS